MTRVSVLNIQVCVPEGWDDHKIESFANREHECGTTNGWVIRREDADYTPDDYQERVGCADRDGFVHVVLTA